MNKQTFRALLDKKMNRQEFLQFSGGALLVLFGLGNVLALLNHAERATQPEPEAQTAKTGFGSRKFGA